MTKWSIFFATLNSILIALCQGIQLNISGFNHLSESEAAAALSICCSASRWTSHMLSQRPFRSIEDVMHSASLNWDLMQEQDWLEAFDGHPKIGDPDSLKKKYQSTHSLASSEQSGVQTATDKTIAALAQTNQNYLDRFGFIFIICATGKSADEMLSAILHRINNDRDKELRIAAAEQLKITHIRLTNLFD